MKVKAPSSLAPPLECSQNQKLLKNGYMVFSTNLGFKEMLYGFRLVP